MRILFMGTPDFAVPSLQILLDHGCEICGVFTQPDKPKGRGHKLQAPPVKELAIAKGLPVYQPQTLRTGEAEEIIRKLAPELIVVVAYGKILPKSILDIPPMGCINVHGSLLPKYRGAAPIQWTVLNGDKVAGVTTMFMAEGMDTGDMLLKAETPVDPEETSGELFDRLKDLGASLLWDTLVALQEGDLQPEKQKEEDAVMAPMLSKELSQISWEDSAEKIHNLIRGLNPWPGAFTYLHGKKMKIHASRMIPSSGRMPGEVYTVSGSLAVACGDGDLLLTEIQPENSKRMDSKSYLLGHPLQEPCSFDK